MNNNNALIMSNLILKAVDGKNTLEMKLDFLRKSMEIVIKGDITELPIQAVISTIGVAYLHINNVAGFYDALKYVTNKNLKRAMMTQASMMQKPFNDYSNLN